MRILAAAKAGFDYNRTRILINGLKGLGHEVELFKIPDRTRHYGRELLVKSQQADWVYVPPFRHRDLSFVRKYSKAPVVFDPLISRYLTKVVDYGHYWKAPQKWLVDYRDFRNCDLLVADTQAHLDYFKKTLALPDSLATAVIPVGVDTDEYQRKAKPKKDTFKIGFYGTFVPLQGTLTIVEALALIKDKGSLEFELLGTGYQFEEAKKLAKNKGLDLSLFKGWTDYNHLASKLQDFDLALGVFGQSVKTDLVVPNKLYHYAALGVPCLTKQTQGIEEVFTPDETILTCQADAHSIAESISYWMEHRSKLSQIGVNAHRRITEHYSHLAIAQKLINSLEKSGLV